MKVCLSCVEFFSWGKYGGFGRATRMIGRELVKRGIDVYAVVPRQHGQKPYEELDGIKVFGFPKYKPWQTWSMYKEIDADIYHASEPNLSTWIAMKAMPHKVHIINFQDARTLHDWKIEYDRPALNKMQVISNYIFEHNFLVSMAIRRSYGVYAQAESQIPKIKKMYHLSEVIPLHNPVSIPASVKKAERPTVGWLNRWDRVKRPELFLELPSRFPNVHFIAAGDSKDKGWDTYLREKYGSQPNLELLGFVNQFTDPLLHSQILEKSWIMVNSSTKEALPNNAFLEAAAHKCAILAGLDYEDGFATNFGFCTLQGDFEEGVRNLLENNRWKERGEKAYEHVKKEYETNLIIDQHLHVYERALQGEKPDIKGTQIDPGTR